MSNPEVERLIEVFAYRIKDGFRDKAGYDKADVVLEIQQLLTALDFDALASDADMWRVTKEFYRNFGLKVPAETPE